MNTTVKASLILAAVVTLLNVIVFALGLHKNFGASQIAFVAGAIALNVGVVYWALAKDAAEKSYGQQVMSALGIGALGGVLILVLSWGLMSVVFPNSIEEMKEGALTFMKEQGTSGDEYEKQAAALEKTTPFSQALPGGVGTFFTSLVSGAVIAAFKRRKA